MAPTGWLIDSVWWWLVLWLPSLAFVIPFGSGRKEHRS